MNFKNNSNFPKSIFLVSLLVVSFASLGVILPNANANHDSMTKTMDPTFERIPFRDVTNVVVQLSSLTLDFSKVDSGILTVSLNETDKNLDLVSIDTVIATANSTTSGAAQATILLNETGVNTGIFNGTLNLSLDTTSGNTIQVSKGDDITVSHDAEPKPIGRLFAFFTGVTGTANVTFSDYLINTTARDIAACPYDLVVQPVEMTFPGTPAAAVTVTMSFANADLDPHIESDLVLVWRPTAGAGFQTIGSAPNNVTKLISNTVQPTAIGGASQSGQYAVAVDLGGCPGGGGGGLVRPGLVVNVLAGAGAISSFFSSSSPGGVPGGGGGGPSAPTIFAASLFLKSEPTFTLLGQGITSERQLVEKDLDDSSGPVSLKTNESVSFSFDLYENQGINNLAHVTMYFFTGENSDVNQYNIDLSKSDTYILFDKTQSKHVVDPHGYFASADFELSEITAWSMKAKYDITFAKPMETTSILIRSWDLDKNESDKVLLDAFQVSESSFLSTPNEISTVDNTFTQTEVKDIPIWVKNNANWWHQRQIDDSDFISGIEYLIEQNIINMPKTEVSDSVSTEVPDWIRDVAGFWGQNSISDAEFVQSVQWLISNGIMVVNA